MAIFGKRRADADVGVFVAPPDPPPAPLSRVVEDGLLVADSAARMAVKNRLIVDVLLRGTGFDRRELIELARATYRELANENLESIRRIEAAAAAAAPNGRVKKFPGGRPAVPSELYRRRPIVYRLMANALEEVAQDDEVLAAVVDRARDAALDEIASAIPQPWTDAEPPTDRTREQRVRALLEIDLPALGRRQAKQA